jgi:hypothetical protein
MNERIKELIKQATTEEHDGFLYFDKKKFAELIVTNAIGVLQKRFMGDLNREDMEVRRCIEDLKKHFGVEK